MSGAQGALPVGQRWQPGAPLAGAAAPDRDDDSARGRSLPRFSIGAGENRTRRDTTATLHMDKVDDAAGHGVGSRGERLLGADRKGWKGLLVVAADFFSVSLSLQVVDAKKDGGTLEFRSFCSDEMRSVLKVFAPLVNHCWIPLLSVWGPPTGLCDGIQIKQPLISSPMNVFFKTATSLVLD